MIDTHTHLYLPDYDSDGGGEAAVSRAIESGVSSMIFPNVGLDTLLPMHRLAERFPRNISLAIGLHPTEVNNDWRSQLETIFDDERFPSGYVAVGEIGIDLYWDKTYRNEQIQALDAQISKAVRAGLPVILHCREGLDETLDVLRSYPDVKGVFHSFGGTEKDVDRIREIGDFYFGINGVVTFKNSGLRDVLPHIGLDRILLETDSPYLTPVPFRGKRNESAYLPYINKCVADSLHLSPEEVDEVTSQSARDLFGLP